MTNDPSSDGGALVAALQRWADYLEARLHRARSPGVTVSCAQLAKIAICHREAADRLASLEGPAQEDDKGPHIRAVEYARAYVVPLYRSDESLTPYERGAVREVAAHFLQGYFAAGAVAGIPQPPPSAVIFAEQLARRAHAGQKEESTGDDYIHHIERVVALVEGDDAKTVAWLHDIVEDTPITHEMLEALGFARPVLTAVRLLTRESPYAYKSYIEVIAAYGNPLAVAVKVADLHDHLRPNCPPRLRPRYERALAELTGEAPVRPRAQTPEEP